MPSVTKSFKPKEEQSAEELVGESEEKKLDVRDEKMDEEVGSLKLERSGK